MQKYITPLLMACMLVACGKSEDQIRTEERARYLERENAELEAELKQKGTAAPLAASEPAAPAATPAPAAPAAQSTQSSIRTTTGNGPMASYVAFIGEDDLYNSSGTRLTQPWAILRQDRANFHKFGVSQSGDTSDSIFGNAANREAMERLLRNGSISADARARITQGGASVRVQVFGQGGKPQRVDVTVQ